MNVLEKSKKEVEYIFKNFEEIWLSFSGGKDSSVGLNLCLEYCRKNNRKINVLIIDLEAHYTEHIDYIERIYNANKKYINLHWYCVPLNLRNAGSIFQPFWRCWDPNEKRKWVRKLPKQAITKMPDWGWEGMEFEDFVPLFFEEKSRDKKIASIVNIRAEESLNRWRTIKTERVNNYKGIKNTTVKGNTVNFYIIGEWKLHDVWKYLYQVGDYNRVYDHMFLKGYAFSKMRICQPFGDDQRQNISLFKFIDPKLWVKLTKRVRGTMNLEKTTGTQLMGDNKLVLPKNFDSWKDYSIYLWQQCPKILQEQYDRKIQRFFYWYLVKEGINNIPDSVENESKKEAPSWRRVAKMIIKNDFWGQELTQGPTKEDNERINKILEEL